ncbi:B-cell CLL/lymphoma 6 member B protein [Salmo salar]|uniref:B-cell CLL/lymphoma 6 member B protein-like n=1 Tax=Salmo salar TaxID=8030 RepID=A0ABM3EMW5_SALSA|nr:B-cell CLL/lymphoma 6 member B protein-like [Salmo salar]XP_045572369.1 B-cell CLL/lymphoma 6 member B protein-like [Salmo salar]
MCDSVAFHAQLASIIEVLANAAVAEICKLVDDGHAALRLEISHSQKEIDNLRRKLLLTKYQNSQRGAEKFGALRRTVHRRDTDLVARARASFVGKSTGRHGYLENRFSYSEGDNFTKDVTNWKDSRCTATDQDGGMQMADMQESPLIKMENLGTSRTEIVQLVSESSETVVPEPGSSSSTETTDLLDQQGNRHRAPDTSLNIEPENQTFQHPASQYSRARQDHQVAECVTWETDHQPISYSLSQWTENQETDNPTVNAPHNAGPDSKRLSGHPERRGASGNSGVCMSALGSLDWVSDVVIVDSVPIKVEADMSSEWSITDQEVTSGEVCSDSRQLVDNRGRGGMESGQTKCPSDTQHPEQGTTVGSRSKIPDFNRLSSLNSFSSPRVTLHQVPQRGKQAPFLNFNRGSNFSSKGKEKQPQQLTSHSTQRQLRCSLCGKPFPQPAQLRSHMRVHTGEKPYGCSHCTKRFSHRHQLKMHERVHTGEKPFHCVYCGKCFTQSSHMKRHLLVHTGGRPQDMVLP